MKTLYALLTLLCVFGAVKSNAYTPVHRTELSNQCVHDIEQDSYGYVWLATANGLCKSFGSDYEIYFADPDAGTATVPANQVMGLHTDSDGRLWIATFGGVCALEPGSRTFRRFTIEGREDEKYGGYGFIHYAGRLLCYGNLGLYSLDLTSGRMVHEVNIDDAPVVAAIAGPDDKLWVSTGATLIGLDESLTPTVRLSFESNRHVEAIALNGSRMLLGTPSGVISLNPADLSLSPTPVPANAEVNHILPLGDGNHLISTDNRGVLVYNTNTGTIGKKYGSIDFSELPTAEINRVFADRDGNLWVATFDKGVVCLTDRPSLFNVDRSLVQAFRSDFVTRVLFDRDSTLLVGTRHNGIAAYNPRTRTKRYFNSHTVGAWSHFGHDFVQAMAFDSRDRLWVGYNNDLFVCDRPSTSGGNLNIIKKFPFFVNAVCIAEDSLGRMWVGTDNLGIFVIDQNLEVVHTVGAPIIRSNNITKVIRYDDNHMLFSAYTDGLYLIDIRRMVVSSFDPTHQKMLNTAVDLMFDRDHNLWIGSYNQGLLRYDTKSHELMLCRGSQTDDMVALCQDNNGNIWVSSSYGVYRYDSHGTLAHAYLTRDGLGGNQFHEKCVATTAGGRIYFGGNAGIEEIVPDNDIAGSCHIPVYISSLRLMPDMRPALTGEMADRAEASVSELTLDHKDNSISIEFSGISYDSSRYVEYAYMLEGLDKGFIELGTHNRVTYSDLPAGAYKFMVKVRHKDCEWQAPVQLLDLTVKASPWLSLPALLIYALLFVLIVVTINRIYLRFRLVRQKYALAEERIIQEKQIAANRINFFTNISHELRTPLTLICGPAKQLKSNYANMSDEQIRESLDFINSNTERLMTLIGQLLSFRRVKNETLPLRVGRYDMGEQLDSLANLYKLYAGENGLSVIVERPHDIDLNLTYDKDKIEKIVNNLIVNAIKYSRGGDRAVTLRMRLTDKPAELDGDENHSYAEISVSDDGMGIDETDIPKIFQPFKRLLGISDKRKTDGFGIGLHFVAHLVKEHKGLIRAEKNPAGGMTFTVIIPVSPEAFDSAEFKDTTNSNPALQPDGNPIDITAVQDHAHEPHLEEAKSEPDDSGTDEADCDVEEDSRPKMLVVEDNVALNAFLHNIFCDKFAIIQAYDGQEGLQKAIDECPDIIISDVRMPGDTDGYALCHQLKTTSCTSHIPVILLTAKVLDENKIQGYNAGADAYLCKPFNPDVLDRKSVV